MSREPTLGPNALAGKKVAVIVESQYIPPEISIYQTRFAGYGASVDLVSRLWGQTTAHFYSTIEPGVVECPYQTLDVMKDFAAVKPSDYDAIIVAANYVSVRLRWSEREDIDSGNAAEVVRTPPAVEFFRAAMEDPRVIKRAACHGLWLLTPCPEVLRGRKVICNKVVLADVINAGAIYTPCPAGTSDEEHVVVDGDLVTNDSWHATEAFVDAIAGLVGAPHA